jgi:hypothetical protein
MVMVKEVRYTRNGREFRRRVRSSGHICAHCRLPLSGRKSPRKRESSIVWVRGRPYHRTCWIYYKSGGKKGTGYKDVPRIMGRRLLHG